MAKNKRRCHWLIEFAASETSMLRFHITTKPATWMKLFDGQSGIVNGCEFEQPLKSEWANHFIISV
jgi:hypothetical protein